MREKTLQKSPKRWLFDNGEKVYEAQNGPFCKKKLRNLFFIAPVLIYTDKQLKLTAKTENNANAKLSETSNATSSGEMAFEATDF